ncbi:FecR domain-containing protein [Flavivirga abyssicola]|uniref:FecR family protein n=1 Tax=Flavivirga abyssicola TaxID=3063533 RepID=UPI0026DF8FBA|nr:FecR domain-containing protein [Flavivirga sp. MEBiC07777]WVK12739.1 FecR domain-containing protein [Flavivirga sp. MEBiC07777]
MSQNNKNNRSEANKAEAIYNQIRHLSPDVVVDIEHEKRKFFLRIDKKRFKPFYRYIAAAVIIGLLVGGYLFKTTIFNTPETQVKPVIVNNTIEIGTDKAVLTLANGSDVVLEEGKAFQTQYASSEGKDIAYKESSVTEIAYNYLTIPRGGKYNVTLADGTIVWLNSDSKLKYPVAFLEGQPREVELLYGEAYFDVSSSIENKGASFKVLTQSQEVEVLGTEFNIKAYKEDPHILTTLVEGEVTVDNHATKKILLPNQQSNLNLSSNTLFVQDVDPYNSIAWKDGVFSFDNESLNDIIITLSRWYDVDIVLENKNLGSHEYVGVFSRDQSIEDILSTLHNVGVINTFSINYKTVTLK